MLIRIRRLAGTAVGAVFILLLSLSMLQMGEVANPLSFFRGSPMVIEVGEQEQRWDSFGLNNAATTTVPSAAAYAPLGFGPLVTALALQDSWNGGHLTEPSQLNAELRARLARQDIYFTEAGLKTALGTLTTPHHLLGAVSLVTAEPRDQLPGALAAQPAAQVTQAYDFDVIRFPVNLRAVATAEDSDLQAYLQENQRSFQRPPTWAIDALILDDSTLAERIEVTDDQVRQYYNSNLAQFTTPEAWEYLDITFLTALEARLFEGQVNQGLDVETALANSAARLTNEGLREADALATETLDLLKDARVGQLFEPVTADDGSVTYGYLRDYRAETVASLTDSREAARAALKLEQASAQLVETIQALQRQAHRDSLSLRQIAAQEGYEIQSFDGLQNAETAPAPLAHAGFFDRLSRVREVRDRPSRYTAVPGAQEMLYSITAYEEPRDLTLAEARDQVQISWQIDQARLANLEAVEAFTAALDAGSNTQRGGRETLKDLLADLLIDLDDPQVSQESYANVSRLSLHNDAEAAPLIKDLDRAALVRFGQVSPTQQAVNLLRVNPDLTSPFTLADGEYMVVDRRFERLLVIAKQVEPLSQETPRASLVATLADTSLAQLFNQALAKAYLDDVAARRPATVNSDVINAQTLAQRQAQARAAGGI